jgi:hypothetical protein
VARFFRELARRFFVGALIGIVVIFLPIPSKPWPLAAVLHVPLGVLIVVLALGKALYDTFFYDRY